MEPLQLVSELKTFLCPSYPNIQIEAAPYKNNPSKLALYFRDEKFSMLYPQQRYHYIIHTIPADFYNTHLTDTVWFELAPGETEQDLEYPDDELIQSITPDVIFALEKSGTISRLDDLLAPEAPDTAAEQCHGDFRHLKRVLAEKGFGQRGSIDEVFDICHVIMSKGGYCDCEVLYNVFDNNRLKSRYWISRVENLKSREKNP